MKVNPLYYTVLDRTSKDNLWFLNLMEDCAEKGQRGHTERGRNGNAQFEPTGPNLCRNAWGV